MNSTTIFSFHMQNDDDDDDDGGRRSGIHTHTQLALMRCLYSPRQNANIPSILILVVYKKRRLV